MTKLLGATIPGSLKELQAVMGRLNFAARFVPGYSRISKPIKELMSHTGGNRWEARHTEALNALLLLAATKLKLCVADWEQEMELHVDLAEGESVGGVVLT